ncbi:MAG TPA: hypothetical protein VG147_08400 [Solirubrobacteraceae bacterium]|jgi:hypothetical protein|nr:hypothetical protein [Solirubrobacteraceae bacterium]
MTKPALQSTRVLLRTDWWKWSFLPLGAVYFVLVVTHMSRMLVNINGNPDTSSAPVLGELYADRAGGHVIMANLPWFSTLIFELATKWLPDHRQVWVIGPYLFGLLAIALMAWTASRVAGRWAAALTAVILLCAGPPVLELMLWLNDHTTTWYSLALLAAFLVLVMERGSTIGWLPLTILILFVGVIVGVNVASDKILLIAGLLPLLFASAGTWILSPNARTAKVMWLGAATAAVTGISAVATTSIMHSAGVFLAYFELRFATLEAISTNVKLWWQSIVLLGNGNFSEAAITFTTILALVCGALSVGMALLVPRYTWRYVASRRSGDEPVDERLSVYIIFWATSLVCLSAGFILSSVPAGLGTTRYLVGVVFAVAAMLPLFARGSVAARALVVAGTLVFLLTATISLGDSGLVKPPSTAGPSPQVAEAIARTAERVGATRGYATYWNAAPITWRSNFRVQVAPFVGCSGSPTGVCPGSFNYLEAWYRPGSFRTFLLTDSSGPQWSPPAALRQRAIATYRFGTVTMYVYNYDIVTSLL